MDQLLLSFIHHFAMSMDSRNIDLNNNSSCFEKNESLLGTFLPRWPYRKEAIRLPCLPPRSFWTQHSTFPTQGRQLAKFSKQTCPLCVHVCIHTCAHTCIHACAHMYTHNENLRLSQGELFLFIWALWLYFPTSVFELMVFYFLTVALLRPAYSVLFCLFLPHCVQVTTFGPDQVEGSPP